MSARRDWAIMLLLGGTLEGMALWVARQRSLPDDFVFFVSGYLAMSVTYGLAVYYVLNHCRDRKGLLSFGLATALALRATFLFTPPVLSDDIYRYIWDGRVQREGINPYRHPPLARELANLRDSVYDGVNNKAVPTIYPPLMQAVFAASAAVSESVVWMKGTFLLADLVLLGVMVRLLAEAGLSPMRSLIYAWSPLVIVEIAGSGHNDVLALAFLLAAHRAILHKKDTLSICFIALSAMSKLGTFALAPLAGRPARARAWIALPVVCLVVAWPYRGAGEGALRGLFAYALSWRANDSLFHVLYLASGSLDSAKVAAAALFAGFSALLLLRRVPPLRAVYLALGALLLLSPTVHPWYLVWIVPYLCLYPSPAWLLLTSTVVLAYHAPALSAEGAPWEEQSLFKLLEYGPFFGMAMLSWLRGTKGRLAPRETPVL